MKLLFNKIFLEHDTGMHPENRKRLESFDGLEETTIHPKPGLLGLVHEKEYISEVKSKCCKATHLDPDTVISSKSYVCALAAATLTVMAAETNDFAVVRPPGHHAHAGRSGGFCIFNNIAIAVMGLLKQSKKVLILDFDGHHGDGTSKIFYENDRVMYISLHQFPAFPGSGSPEDIGEGKGKGYTVNFALPPGSGDDIFMNSFDSALSLARQFKPDCVAVSAGFDSHQKDLLLDLRLSLNSYHEIGEKLRGFKALFACLEGGYNVDVLSKCVHNFVDGINGRPQRFEEEPTDSTIVVSMEHDSRTTRLERALKDYWRL